MENNFDIKKLNRRLEKIYKDLLPGETSPSEIN